MPSFYILTTPHLFKLALTDNDAYALRFAASTNNTGLMQRLISSGANVTSFVGSSYGYYTALDFAIAEGNLETTKLLLEHGSTNPYDTITRFQLHFPARRGDIAMLQLLHAPPFRRYRPRRVRYPNCQRYLRAWYIICHALASTQVYDTPTVPAISQTVPTNCLPVLVFAGIMFSLEPVDIMVFRAGYAVGMDDTLRPFTRPHGNSPHQMALVLLLWFIFRNVVTDPHHSQQRYEQMFGELQRTRPDLWLENGPRDLPSEQPDIISRFKWNRAKAWTAASCKSCQQHILAERPVGVMRKFQEFLVKTWTKVITLKEEVTSTAQKPVEATPKRPIPPWIRHHQSSIESGETPAELTPLGTALTLLAGLEYRAKVRPGLR
ncbi:hypothetical protein K440DRAFT_636153 [Wilcoxina mikolae CBS 423.85]|nr:hypothetical protein K440DRAFT_636153 [Wilcoxina mikolae CBS 423.85]